MTEPTPSASRELGLIARAIGVVTAPTATFTAVVQSPRSAAMLLLVAILIGAASAAPQFTEKGRQAILAMQVQQIERFTGQPVSDEMYQQFEVASQSNMGGVWALVGTLVVMPIVALFFAGLYWGIFNTVMGGTATFKQVLGIVSHSMVIMALGALAAMPVQLMAEKMTATGPFHLGALAPMLEPTSTLANFLAGMNLFTLWQIGVIAIGLGVLYRKKAGPIGIALVVAYALLVAVIVTAFSSFMGR